MSSGSVAVVSGVGLIAPLAIGGAIVGGAGYGIAQLAYAMAQQLQKDYEQAKADLQSRCASEEAARTAWIGEAAIRERDANAFIDALGYAPIDATTDYIRNRLTSLIARARSAGHLEQVSEGEHLFALAGHDAESILDDVLSYAAKIDAAVGRSVAGSTQPEPAVVLELMFAAFEQELEDTKTGLQLGIQLEFGNQLDRLRKVGASQPNVALQGLSLLQAKARRLVRESLKAASATQKSNAHRREVVTEVVAKLRAVAACPGAPAYADRAQRALQDLANFLRRPDTGSPRELEAFLAKAEALFVQCQQALDAAVTSAIVQETVSEALLQRGYVISQVPPEFGANVQQSLVALSDQLGLAYSIDAFGQLRTEAVAFADIATEPDEAAEETICKLVDEIYASLRKKGAEVREQGRRRRKTGERLRVVTPQAKVANHVNEESLRRVRS